MGQFKPMVKMMTTEPSVILKLKKGGKVEKKADGGFMPMASSMPAGLPARGGLAPAASPMKPPMAARRKAMMAKPAMSPTLMKKGGKADKHDDAAQDRAMIKKAMAGKKFASGGSITASMDKTTVKGNVGKFAKTDMETADRNNSAKGTGKVKNGNGGGYAVGGTVSDKVASKFTQTDMETADRTTKAKGTGGVKNGNGGGYASGGTIKGGNWENRPADTTKPGKSGGTTGGVKNGNGGGYKMGGSAKKAYATGGTVDTGKPVAMPKRPVSKPVANSMQSGTFAKGGKVEKAEKPNLRLLKTYTGPKGHVAKVYKDRDWQEYRTKFYTPDGKYLTEGDSHTDDAEDAHSTAKNQVENSRYKHGGTAKRYAEGDLVDASKGAYDAASKPSKEDMDMAKAIRSIPSKLYEGAKSMMGMTPKPAGSVTKTEKSVTVAPSSKKRGGRC